MVGKVNKVNLERWGPHLAAAKREGVSLAQYAHSHGLSRHTLYVARQMLRTVGGNRSAGRRRAPQRQSKAVARSAFASVKLLAPEAPASASVAQMRAQLPNGVRLELLGVDAVLLAAAIRALAGR